MLGSSADARGAREKTGALKVTVRDSSGSPDGEASRIMGPCHLKVPRVVMSQELTLGSNGRLGRKRSRQTLGLSSNNL